MTSAVAARQLRTGIVAMEPPATRQEWLDRVRRIDDQGHAGLSRS